MANLEAKTKMSAVQLGIVITSTGIGAQLILASRKTAEDAGHLAWLSVILGGLIFYSASLCMLKLGEQYPDSTLAEYMPKLWGRVIGQIVIGWFMLLFLIQVCTIVSGVSKAIAFFMFYRTPTQVIALGLLVICIYCALQDWGTFLRMQQLLFFITVPTFSLLWSLSLLNFQPQNLLPLWSKEDIPGLITATFFDSWNMYGGYEIILFLLPMTVRGKIGLAGVLKWSFICMCLLFLSIIVIAVGVLTINGVRNTVYPTMTVISSVEIPGTFIERLDTYLVISWIPIVFDTVAIYLWVPCQVLKQCLHYTDHRPLVLALTPLLYAIIILLDTMKIFEAAGKLATWIGLIFSLGIIPASLVLNWWKKRGTKLCKSQ